MIWNDSHSIAPNPELDKLTTHIATEIQSAVGDYPENTEMPEGNEIARSVAEFIINSEDFPLTLRNESERTRHSDGILIPSDYLLIMTCRALWSVGCEQSARDLLRTKARELNISASYTNAIFGKGLFPCLAMHSALVRALKPSSSLWSINGPCWILNLRTIFSFLNAGVELTVWRVMHVLIKEIAVLWDISGGKGTMGLKNTNYLFVNILGFPRKSNQGRKFAMELIRYCEQDLKMAANERNWRFTPMVMDIDA